MGFGSGFREKVQGAVESAKAAADELKKQKTADVKGLFRKKPETPEQDKSKTAPIKVISTRSALEIIYYLMAADGQVFHSEEEKFDLIGRELDPDFPAQKEEIVRSCQARLDQAEDAGDYADLLRDGVEDALLRTVPGSDAFLPPKLLVWNLLTVAYSDEHYDDAERRLIKYIVRKTGIDQAVLLEMESSLQAMMAIERELNWIKTTNRPYLVIEAMVNELADRKNVIAESVTWLVLQ